MKYLFFIFLSLSFAGMAQPVYFNTQIDFGHRQDYGISAISIDSGYLLTGYTQNYQPDRDSAFIVSLRKDGSVRFAQKLTVFPQTLGIRLLDTPTGFPDYFLAGIGYTEDYHQHIYIARLRLRDSVQILWTKTYALQGSDLSEDHINNAIRTTDGGIAMTGYVRDSSNQVFMSWVKTDSSGALQFYKKYDLNGANPSGTGLTELPSGGFVTCGILSDPDYDYGLYARIKADGTLVWWRKDTPQAPVYNIDYLALAPTPDGNFLTVGSSVYGYPNGVSHFQRFRVTLFNSSGQALDSKEYGAYQYAWFQNIHPAPDGNFIASGSCYYADGNLNYFRQYGVVAKINASGNLLWMRKYHFSANDYNDDVFKDAVPAADGGILCVGQTWGGLQEQDNIWAVKLDSLGCLQPGCAPSVDVVDLPIGLESRLRISPNPSAGPIRLEADGSITACRISDTKGRTVMCRVLSDGISALDLDVNALPAGLYFVTALVDGVYCSGALVRE